MKVGNSKIGKITKATQKGQIVIPKEYRDVLQVKEGTPLHISLKGQGIYIQPVEDIIHREESKARYGQVSRVNKNGFWELSGSLRSSVSLSDKQLQKARDAFEKQWPTHH